MDKAYITKGREAIKRAKDTIEKKTGKTTEQLFEERDQLVNDIIHLKVPDRMPVHVGVYHLATKYAGLPQSARFYDPAAYGAAVLKVLLDFDLDIFSQMDQYRTSGLALEALGTKQYLWPGGPLKPDQHAQTYEIENMKENEYDLFMTSPDDYILRCYLPRAFKSLEPFAKLPPMRSLLGPYALVPQLTRFISPELIKAFESLLKAAKEQQKCENEGYPARFAHELGFVPISHGGGVVTPFDVLTDYLRSSAGVAVDMFKRPEKLTAAFERLLEWHLARMAPAPAKEKGKRRVGGGGGHWSSSAFLSRKQFDKFYWPTWKKSMLAAIDMGYIPVMGCEVTMEDRLDCFLELPKGKALLFNDLRDIAKAKQVLGGHMAFMGGVPTSLLWGASPQEVEEYCKNAIKVGGKGGGFILACRAREDDSKPANVKAMVDAIRKYGRY